VATHLLKAEPDLVAHLGFILSEEEALKSWLTGVKVPTRPGSTDYTNVNVWFRWPEGERQISYPYITIDLLSVEPNYGLWTSTYIQDPNGLYQPSVRPDLPPPPQDQVYNIREYLAMDLVWQIAVYSRSALHDRYLTSIFTTDILPPRPFFITNPADDVARRVDRLAFQTADAMETTESGTKRIFRKLYTISMLTEIPQQRFFDDIVGFQALRVYIPVVAREQFDSYFAQFIDGQLHPTEDFTDEEREAGGEYFYVAHEGADTPSA
jgi:hypothetical protein